MTLTVAEFETRHFTFTAYGRDRVAAQEALISGLKKHAKQYQLDDDWYLDGSNEKTFIENNVSFHRIATGCCFRDNELIQS